MLINYNVGILILNHRCAVCGNRINESQGRDFDKKIMKRDYELK